VTIENEIHVGDVGTRIRATFKDTDASGAEVIVDVSTATTLELVFRKPISGDAIVKTATKVTDGTDGEVQYIAEQGFFDEAGTWLYQGFADVGDWSGHSERDSFPVLANLRST